MNESLQAEVIAVFPDKVKIAVDNIDEFNVENIPLKVGSYLRISDNENVVLMAIIENFSIVLGSDNKKNYIIEALPLGLIIENEFSRGGDALAIPPKKVEPATASDIESIYSSKLEDKDRFAFCKLSTQVSINVPVDGNKFFNKHIAIIGSTGSGKSHTVATIIQKAINEKNGEFSLNNSHVIIFDIHSEYKKAFPDANILSIDNLVLPYWLLNSEELEEILLDTGERDNYNQSSIFRTLVTANKKKHNASVAKIHYDSPLFFSIDEIRNALHNIKDETKNAKAVNRYMINDGSTDDLSTTPKSGIELTDEQRYEKYFETIHKFYATKSQNITKGDYAEGKTLDKFVARFDAKISDSRLEFLFGKTAKGITFEDVLKRLMGYIDDSPSNVTVIDLSGIPFEVLSITVSLISRLLFEYGYYYKRIRFKKNPDELINNDIPILMVYEEAHKYVPKSELSKFRSSQKAIERIAKEGRKYGVTLLLASQRPSEISETIFSQCNNFIAMRLTNPNDQSYVKKLLPDTLGNLVDKLPSLKAGAALLVGDAIPLPSLVQIDPCPLPPSSTDIPFWDLWREEWKALDVSELKDEWRE